MSLKQRKPLPKLGPVKKRWASWQRSQAEVVKKREGGICAGCGKDSRPLQVAHLLGRRNIIAEPWASWSGLCAHLCSAHPGYGLGCHEVYDARRDPALRHRLLEQAEQRLAAQIWALPGERFWLPTESLDPADKVRAIVRRLEALGITPDPSRELEES